MDPHTSCVTIFGLPIAPDRPNPPPDPTDEPAAPDDPDDVPPTPPTEPPPVPIQDPRPDGQPEGPYIARHA
jgi:hypothetical protein